jgi:F-type H+-transporting ATPase subunit b
MEQTIQALGGILLKAIPTIVLLLILHFYLKYQLFAPLEKVLKQRRELTEGARKAAEDSLAAAERKAQEYESKLREARAQIYKEQEEIRRRWLEDQAAQMAQARGRAETVVKDAKYAIATEVATARQNLFETSSTLADEIAAAVLARRAA